MSRKSILTAVAVALVGTVIGVIVVTPGGESDSTAPARPGSVVIERAGGLAITAAAEFRVVYRIDDYSSTRTVTSTEEVRVRRPFDARVERRQGPPPGGAVISTQITRLGRVALPTDEEASLTFAVPPELAATDLRFDPALEWLEDERVAPPREWREVADRPCRVYRFGAPLSTGTPKRYDPEIDEHADLCIDETSIVLEEVWVVDGSVLRRRVAVDVDTSSGLTDAELADPSALLSPEAGGGVLRRVEPGSSPARATFAADVVPPGFVSVGRFESRPPTQQGAAAGQSPLPAAIGVIDVWVRGPDLLVLEQGESPASAPAYRPDTSAPTVAAGPLDTWETHHGVRMNELRHVAGQGTYTRVRATLPMLEVTAVAAGLRQVPPGIGLVYIDE